MAENKKRKKYFAIWVAAAIVFILIGALVSFIVSSKFAERVSRVFSDLNPFKPEGKPDDGGGSNLSKAANATAVETTTAGGGGGSAGAEEVEYGSGKLRIVNWLSDSELGKGYHTTFHQSGGTDELDYYDAYYSAFFSPSGKSTKIISRITDYELRVDTRGVDSTSTIYLELSFHTQSGGSVTLTDVANELRLSIDPNNKGWNFANKTLTIQQYNPSNTSESFTSYDVREVIDDGGVITLARLDGSYDSEEPYAWFKVGFS